MDSSAFGAKLTLVLKALSLSRARLAAELSVDKSLVGRWASGAVTPSTYNLERLTAHIAKARPDFTLLDWDLEPAALARRLGVEAAAAPAKGEAAIFGQWIPPALGEEIAATSRARASAYEGFWRSTRPLYELPGHFVHDQIMIRLDERGMLLQDIGLSGYVFRGWLIPLHNQLFGMAVMHGAGMLVFSIFHGVARQKAAVMDGLVMSCMADAGGSPVAMACLMERVGDLSGNRAADEETFAEMIKAPPLAPEGSIPPEVRDHLWRDVGPAAAAAGGDPTLAALFARSMSRGGAIVPADWLPPAPPVPPTLQVIQGDRRGPVRQAADER